jgi:AcrR family transcriptional regulator
MTDGGALKGAAHVGRHARGRPRSERANEAIRTATLELLAEAGLDGTTTQAIADRAHVARATIYLRWPTREALIDAALRHAIGREPFPLSGGIATDIRRGAEQSQGILSEPLFESVLPALVREFLTPDQAGVTFDALFPHRRRFAEEYDRLAADQGFRDDIDGETVADLVIGSMVARLLATTSAPTASYVDQVVDVILRGLRRTRQS